MLSKGCSARTDDASTEQVVETEVEEVQPAESAPEATGREEIGTFNMPEPEQESQEEVNTEEEEIRIMPAPEDAEKAPSEEDPSLTAF